VLPPTDYLSHATMLGYEGKMLRRGGYYQPAVHSLTAAVDLWRRNNCMQQHAARDLTQLSFAEHLQARRLEDQLDLEAAQRSRRQGQTRDLAHFFDVTLKECDDPRLINAITPACQAALRKLLENHSAKLMELAARQRTDRRLELADRLRGAAWSHADEAFSIFEKTGFRRGLINVLLYQATFDIDQGQFDSSRKRIDRAALLAEERRDGVGSARVGLVRGRLHLVTGATGEAIAEAQDVWGFAAQTQNPRLKGRSATLCGECAKGGENLPEARRWCDRALTFLEQDGSRDYAWEELVRLNITLTPTASIENLAAQLLQDAMLEQISLTDIADRFKERIVVTVKSVKGSIERVTRALQTGEGQVRSYMRRTQNGSDRIERNSTTPADSTTL